MSKIIKFFIIIFLILDFEIRSEKVTNYNLAVIKFKNQSDYKGNWDIELEFAKLILNRLKEKGFTNIILVNEESNISKTNLLIISGVIKQFKFKENTIAFYRLGGYKNYSVGIKLEINIRGKVLNEVKNFESYISRKEYGLALFGGPGGSDDFEKPLYYELQKIRFGSEEFWRSIYGEAVDDCFKKILEWSLKFLKSKNTFKEQ